MQGPTVFIVHDSAEVREAVGRLVESMGHPVAGFGNAQEFLTAHDPTAGGCMILGLFLPGMSGLEFQHLLGERKIELPVIFLTPAPDVHSAVEAMKGGAIDFLEVPFRPHELWAAIQKGFVIDGKRRSAAAQWSGLENRMARLTPGEWRVFGLLVIGKQKKAIATELGLSTRSIEIRRTKLMRKLQAASLADLIRIAAHLKSSPISWPGSDLAAGN